MSKGTKSDTTKDTTAMKPKGTLLTELQAQFDKEQSQGFRGTEVDPTPNENYTVAGVVANSPTPETHAESAKEARDKTGLGLSGIEASARENERGKK